jgi:hypothetical protein
MLFLIMRGFNVQMVAQRFHFNNKEYKDFQINHEVKRREDIIKEYIHTRIQLI